MLGFGSRACARCGKELTDAASMDCGIGPICRKLDNALLARTIPADPTEALRVAVSVTLTNLVEPTRPTMEQVVADLIDHANKDWRKTVKRVEWLCSWGHAPSVRGSLIDVVRALGYVGLAALLSGEAATGSTLVTFENGRLFLYGPRNKAGRLEIKKIYGYRFHAPSANAKAAWSVPASAADAFAKVVITYWPNVTGLEESVEAAKAAPAAAPVAAAADCKCEDCVKPSPVSVTEANGWLKIATPYNKDFVTDIKTLPYKSRKWNQIDKVWEVTTNHASFVHTTLKKHYPTDYTDAWGFKVQQVA